ncbi:MAG: hypothetical protein KAX31_05350, partial [Thermoplasmata archaeon]|nr:hypothetical protein [Thermoplasmata archaeon]
MCEKGRKLMNPVQLKDNQKSISSMGMGPPESTELSLFVRTSDEDVKEWDRQRIHEALIRETNISEDAASIVAREVEKLILSLDMDFITAPLIRELTNAKLVEYGLAKIRKQHTRLGVPLY